MAESNVSKTLANIKKTAGTNEAKVQGQIEAAQAPLKDLQTRLDAAIKGTTSKHSKRFRKEQTNLKESLEKQIEAQQAEVNTLRSQTESSEMKRNKDLVQGAEFGASVLGDEGLGRLSDDAEVTGTLDKFKAISEQGLSRGELAAERAQATRSIDSATQTGMRGLQARLAKMGVKGSVAGQQILQREMGGAQQKADLAQNLFLKSEQVKREGLKDYSQRLGEVKTFDLGQAAKEKDIITQAGLGFAKMGSSERTAAFAAEQSKEASIASARASKPSCFLGDNKLVLNNGIPVNFKDLEPGMVLEDDNLIMAISKHLAVDALFDYKGVKVTGDHFVWENDFFIPVKESVAAVKIDYPLNTLYVFNIITDSGIIKINNIVFSDWEDDQVKEDYEKIQKLLKGKVRSHTKGE